MKEENHLHHQSLLHLKRTQLQHLLSPKKLNSATTYLLFFTVAYALGFLSSYTIIQQTTPQLQSPPQPHISDSELFRFNSTCADPVPSKLGRQTLLDRLFNGSSPFDAFPPPHAVPLLRQKRIKGWGSTGAVFETLIRRVKPRTIVEVGSFLGASAIHMAELTRRLGLKTQILCIDDFRGWPGFRDRFRDIKMVNGDVMLMYQFMQNVAQSNFTEVILPVPFSSGSALAQLCDLGVYADLIEVDAGHDFHSAWADINRAHTILRPGGVIFGHDYFTAADNRGVRRAVNLFAKVKGLKVIPHGQHWVLA
ncbi:hypothetical protein MRB53_025728 [Persea americana]|uniref:Uncharacterized protein n=1 Tax=Persea americana TaxID=3435 RepID=A0ACC2LG88_PERAE|nr:hypothetical protein MRB53_025728 [Persea americana]|eukprot:TRINITY_DN5742_c0_g1_i1.p1 TRINITY_DN5742_c0_g1~~TRINITY_DN5742_c0_g1_i1.p1  ORF type:complete len:308 (-),score=17.57 TRINITY_DN5742_c0_g1_i1:341-1264(-)